MYWHASSSLSGCSLLHAHLSIERQVVTKSARICMGKHNMPDKSRQWLERNMSKISEQMEYIVRTISVFEA